MTLLQRSLWTLSRASVLIWVATSLYNLHYLLHSITLDHEFTNNHWITWIAYITLIVPISLLYYAMIVPIMFFDLLMAVEPLFSGDWTQWHLALDACVGSSSYFNYDQIGKIRNTPWKLTNASDYFEVGHVVHHRGIYCTDRVVHTLLVTSALLFLCVQLLRVKCK